MTLEGAWDGIYFFIVPQWDRIYDVKVSLVPLLITLSWFVCEMGVEIYCLFCCQIWYAAAGQCFLSLGTGFGIITMLSSYNQFSHNIYKCVRIIFLYDFKESSGILNNGDGSVV